MIPVLVPRDLTPSGSSRTGHTLRQLDRIGQFQVISSPTSHPDPYTVHIRLVRPPNRQATSTGQPLLTPILAAKRDETSKNASELSVTRDFAAFTELRRNILALTRQYHPQHCALCTRLGLLLLSSFSQPTLPLKTFLRSSNQRAKHLQLFLQDVVVIMSVHRSRCAHTCAAHRVLPILLHDFFFEAAIEAARSSSE
ncbi:hypothetical protein Poli38472_002635 [Pythium oligandrum]|uniref:Uncharacterized protein n=1 Tax=Pythium oligandrum TaxID=41045 RepID=A0A8K1CII7_PYTOL|nr:hypothetical protein Poli38472_002635 [Pythium oligandrum]|eukprot:TMW63694.1 hypothetical protein Poli38472_002635 [Pythium oligandrum]